MKKQICLIILLSVCSVSNSQNLVPNSSFELYSGCPDWLAQMDSALSWFNPTSASPDYFNQCATVVNVPNSIYGFQYAHSGGAFCGIVLWGPNASSYREYIEVPIQSSLISGMCYHFEMYVNVPDDYQYATDDIGVYFSNTIMTGAGSSPLPYTAQINNTSGMITDTLNWELIEGDYVAAGGENYMVIGNFKSNVNTDTMLINSNAPWTYAYVYIDDVSLVLFPPCNTGINALNKTDIINIYPNPFSNNLNVQINDNEESQIVIYDLLSRKLLEQNFRNSVTLNTEQLEKGLYLYEVQNKNGLYKNGKIVKY